MGWRIPATVLKWGLYQYRVRIYANEQCNMGIYISIM